jgi:osmoprotectant transport system substrate-binding protein
VKGKRLAFQVISLAMIGSILVAACGATSSAGPNSGGKPATIVVGSKNFTEEFIIGQMYALLLENAGYAVTRKLDLGGTPVAQAAITSGQIDLYPEYTGTALLTVLNLPPNHDEKQVYQTVSKAYKDQFKLTWLDAAPMNDTQALAMTQDGSQKFGITTISQMVAKASQLTMIGPPEFQSRPDGLPGLMKTYGDFQLKRYIAVDPGLRYQGLTSGQADVVVAFGTDGEVSVDKLVLLKDDKGLFPPYQIAPVVRADVLQAHPDVATILNKLAPKLTDGVMQDLNYQVDGMHKEPLDVAKAFLTQQGFLK